MEGLRFLALVSREPSDYQQDQGPVHGPVDGRRISRLSLTVHFAHDLSYNISEGMTVLRTITLVIFIIGAIPAKSFGATTSMRFLYPSFSGTWAVPWIAKEAGYLNAEGLDVELIRVGGSTRMVAALLGGSAPLIHAGAPAAFAASIAGSDVVIIAAVGSMSPFRLMARPEIKQPADLKGKKAGITTFGSTSDQMVRLALKHFGLEPNKDVALLPLGGQPEAFAAMQGGSVQVVPMSYPLYLSALKLGMRELIRFSDLGFEERQRQRDYDAILSGAAARNGDALHARFCARHAPVSNGQRVQQTRPGQVRQNYGQRPAGGDLAGVRPPLGKGAASFVKGDSGVHRLQLQRQSSGAEAGNFCR